MILKLLTEHHLEFLSLKGGCRGLSKSTLVKMKIFWKSHAAAQFISPRYTPYILSGALNDCYLTLCKGSQVLIGSQSRELITILSFTSHINCIVAS